MNNIKKCYGYKISARRNIGLWNIPCQLQYLLESWVLGKIKVKNLINNKISYCKSKTSLIESNWLLIIAIDSKNKWTIWLTSWFFIFFSVVILDAFLKGDICDMFVSFDEVIILKMRCMVETMTADDLFCKLEMEYLIFS